MLWGAQAAAKRPLLEVAVASRQCVLAANHPSPLSARRGPTPFIGCGHFGKASAFLEMADPGRPAIDWRA
jgi:uracil-DNA glycosylase